MSVLARFRSRTNTPYKAFSFLLLNTHTGPDEVKAEVDTLADVFRVMQLSHVTIFMLRNGFLEVVRKSNVANIVQHLEIRVHDMWLKLQCITNNLRSMITILILNTYGLVK